MNNKLKEIIDEFGRNSLAYPDDLCTAMRNKGMAEKDILTIQLILKCCPSVPGLLISGDFAEPEINMLIRSTVKQTGLSVSSVRSALGMLLNACGCRTSWMPHLISRESKSIQRVMPVTIEEGETFQDLQERLASNTDSAEVLSDLNTLAEQGNVDANYKLGQYYKIMDDQFHTEKGLPYFIRAAELGYGPANGAVAEYMLRREHKNMAKIDELFRNPTALSGADGREWTKISSQVLRYQQENKGRQKTALIRQLIFLLLSFAATLIGGGFRSPVSFLCDLSVVLQAGSLLWSIFIILFKPMATVKYAYLGMTIGCLLMILGLF